MLPRSARLTSPEDFARTTKSGVRTTSKSLVGYLYLTNQETAAAKCGLIISKSVGGSVQRHRIARQLRHGLQPEISSLPTGALLVIRALPTIKSANINSELKSVISKLILKSTVQK